MIGEAATDIPLASLDAKSKISYSLATTQMEKIEGEMN
jgi:hypothetical protein